VEKCKPTLLIDEGDTFMVGNNELRGIINAGHTRAGSHVIRLVGDNYDPKNFSVWGAQVIAMIGAPPETIEDRSIIIQLQRKRVTDRRRRLTVDCPREIQTLARKAARWAVDRATAVAKIDPTIPIQLNDRAADNWRPLLAIAECVGETWAVKARAAAIVLSGVETANDTPTDLLLGDLRDMFDDRYNADRLETKVILDALHEMDDRPYNEWGKDRKPINEHALSNILRKYGVRSTASPKRTSDKWREGSRSCRGYYRERLSEVFERYAPAKPPQVPHAPEPITYEENEAPQRAGAEALNAGLNLLRNGGCGGCGDSVISTTSDMNDISEMEV
jgi:putative DNA primase/helicase